MHGFWYHSLMRPFLDSINEKRNRWSHVSVLIIYSLIQFSQIRMNINEWPNHQWQQKKLISMFTSSNKWQINDKWTIIECKSHHKQSEWFIRESISTANRNTINKSRWFVPVLSHWCLRIIGSRLTSTTMT